ncbi:DUF3429 domain-containing protein [Halomonas sp. M1]|uniref:DUF3429 domain-containing protein n=1 Tax=Halomonas sp. M1 TaxID=3035470 RepID=UPI002485F222|nr:MULTISPECIES: DUF3429 domain-containing protein [unclassified Halomonas]MDP3536058.1 DUF3429 domain-containing protein [Halomonas sp.]WFE71361.1 DUF3429 domain-containing protein [Halomonas sp. M1]
MKLLCSDRRLAWGLGVAGLIPFAVALLLAWWGPTVWQVVATYSFVYYSAVILSFLGGVHWGAAIQNAQEGSRRRLVLAMVPSLLAWPALMMNTVSGLWILLAGFILIGGYDMSREGRVGFPRWYLMLRAVLTLVVAIFHGFLLLRLRG